jgi:hypothetical protein
MSLYQRYLDYLNQALPDISGIFRSAPAQAMEETTEETVAQPAGLTPEQLALLYPQNQGGRDDGPQGGYGAFGNLLEDSKKQFEVARYNPKTKQYDILDTVDGYLDPITGTYKTYEGKNIRHAGLEIPSMLQGIATLIGLDKGPQSGDIGSIAALEKLKRDQAIQTGIMTATDDSDPGIIPTNIIDAGGSAPGGGYATDYYGGGDSGPSGPPSGPGESSSDAGFGGPGETSSGSFGSSTNDSDFSDYS